jgi:hypothetical protein
MEGVVFVDFIDVVYYRFVLIVGAMREVQSKHIDAFVYEAKEFFISIAGGAYSGDNFGFV